MNQSEFYPLSNTQYFCLNICHLIPNDTKQMEKEMTTKHIPVSTRSKFKKCREYTIPSETFNVHKKGVQKRTIFNN